MLAVRLLFAVVLAIAAGCTAAPAPRSPPGTPPPDTGPPPAQPHAGVVAKAVEATVVLYAGQPGRRWIACAGAHIAPTRILTAEHCLKGGSEWDGQIWYRHRGDALDDAKPARMVAADGHADLGLLETFEPWPHYLDVGENGIGDPLFAVGHPKGITWHVTHGRCLAWYDYIDLTDWGDITVNQYAETDVPIKPGNSGGPLVNAQGQLVGIASFYRPTMGLAYFVSWREIVSFLVKV